MIAIRMSGSCNRLSGDDWYAALLQAALLLPFSVCAVMCELPLYITIARKAFWLRYLIPHR